MAAKRLQNSIGWRVEQNWLTDSHLQ